MKKSHSMNRVQSVNSTTVNNLISIKAHHMRQSKQEGILRCLSFNPKFGAKIYQTSSLLNFPMTFGLNGHFDNESLQTEFLKLQMKIQEENKEN